MPRGYILEMIARLKVLEVIFPHIPKIREQRVQLEERINERL